MSTSMVYRWIQKYCHPGILLGALIAGHVLFGQENIAVTTKAKAEAKIKRSTSQTYNQDLSLGTLVRNKDWIRTGTDGYGVLVFIDDKSQLKIQSGSEVEILGTSDRKAAAISKQLRMETGKVKAEIASQGKRRFTISTPTSVASVKGTIFWMIVDSTGGDHLFVRSGQVLFTNISSGDSVLVGENEAGYSSRDGEVNTVSTGTVDGTVQDYTAGEYLRLTGVRKISGTTGAGVGRASSFTISLSPSTVFENGPPSAGDRVEVTGQVLPGGGFQASIISPSDDSNHLEIEFENQQGDRKKIEIDY